jgi:aromatic ring hydroxylase
VPPRGNTDVMVSGLYEYRFQTDVRAHLMLVLEREPRTENRSVSTHKNAENLKMKVDQIPSLRFLKTI